jgi:hypothetical protein
MCSFNWPMRSCVWENFQGLGVSGHEPKAHSTLRNSSGGLATFAADAPGALAIDSHFGEPEFQRKPFCAKRRNETLRVARRFERGTL